MKWSYGITTVPSRFDNLLPRTIESLKQGGFDKPHLFVDDYRRYNWPDHKTTYHPNVRTAGHWWLSMLQLYLMDPLADRYVLFQDDILCYRNLCPYLNTVEMVPNCYWNLYTVPSNNKLGAKGFTPSNQLGKGALALVFSNEGLRVLFSSRKFVDRPMSAKGWRSVDGGIIDSMREAGWFEYVHQPTLVFHTGGASSMGNRPKAPADTFRGELYDAMELV